MAYTLMPAEENERKLLFKLNYKDAEGHGAIGYLRADFGKSGSEFYTTWFDWEPHLKTGYFSYEFDEVIHSLRNEGDTPPFASRESLVEFCTENAGLDLKTRGTGFKIRTLGFSYYVSPSLDDKAVKRPYSVIPQNQ
jgi:hypothetical protein